MPHYTVGKLSMLYFVAEMFVINMYGTASFTLSNKRHLSYKLVLLRD